MILWDPMDLHSPWNSPGQNTGVGTLSLLQGIFPTRDWTHVSHIASGFFTSWATREAQKWLRPVQLFMIPRTVAYQAPLSMKFSNQEYWSGFPFPSQGVFPTQGLNPGLPHCRWTLIPSEPPGFIQNSKIWKTWTLNNLVKWHMAIIFWGFFLILKLETD